MFNIDVLKIKGILKYFQNNKNNTFKDFEIIMESAETSSSNVTLKDRKQLLNIYLYMYGKKHIKEFMKLLNYQEKERIELDLFEIIENSISNEENLNQELRGEIIVGAIIDEIINKYLLNDELLDDVTTKITINNEVIQFLSFNKIKPLVIEGLRRYSYIEDIRTIIEKIVIEYKKISYFDFLDISELEKYEVYLKKKDSDGNIFEDLEILYTL